MKNTIRILLLILLLSIALPCHVFALGEAISNLASSTADFAKGVGKNIGIGEAATEIDRDATIALDRLLKSSEAAAKVSAKARAILVFPKILKAGLGIGGHHGNGALREAGKTVGYYKTVAGSYGLQIGAQSFGYAMFFMDDSALKYLLNQNDGWEVGVGPSLVFVDDGIAKTMNNTTMTESVYVFTFNQKGLMAGAGIQGSKISRIYP